MESWADLLGGTNPWEMGVESSADRNQPSGQLVPAVQVVC